MSAPAANANIARYLALMAASQPDTPALKIPCGRTKGPPAEQRINYLTLTFAELDAEVDAWCARLRQRGVHRGMRTLVMVRQGLPLIAAVFALFKLGAVPVVIDPGIGRETFLRCVTRSKPRALVGILSARLLSYFFPTAFSSVTIRVSASSSLTARLTKNSRRSSRLPETPACLAAPNTLAAVLFTSGSTGAPKGVCYEHGMFDAQVSLIRDTYGITPGEIDLPLLPIFALFNPALGMTTIVPEIDPREPAGLDPAKIVQAILQENVTNSFGSPTLWRKIGDHCLTQKTALPSLRRVLCAGAPVPATLWRDAPTFLPHGQLHSPYGATEALPVTSVSGDEIEIVRGPGACVGRPVRGIQVKIITVSDERVETLADTQEMRSSGIGEIIVRGPNVTKAYDDNPPATTAAKISYAGHFASGGVWHRMGDCGYFDAEGRLWFCGRKAERVETAADILYTEPCEQIFRAHPKAARCALIGLGKRGNQQPALVVEATIKDPAEAQALVRELHALAQQHPHTAAIRTFFFHPKFPVDVRHNAKIHRLALAKWAAGAKGFEVGAAPRSR